MEGRIEKKRKWHLLELGTSSELRRADFTQHKNRTLFSVNQRRQEERKRLLFRAKISSFPEGGSPGSLATEEMKATRIISQDFVPSFGIGIEKVFFFLLISLILIGQHLSQHSASILYLNYSVTNKR